MSRVPIPHTLSDLVDNKRIYPEKLRTDILQEFYCTHLVPNAYIFKLSNSDTIKLTFSESQFCHTIGLSYFDYNGQSGWDKLVLSPKTISDFESFPKYKMVLSRIINFNRILQLLNSPDVYLYNAEDFPQFNYKSNYFAVFNSSNRLHKLGIGVGNDGIHYGETYIVSLDKPEFNKELAPKNLLTIIDKDITTKEDFLQRRHDQLEQNSTLSDLNELYTFPIIVDNSQTLDQQDENMSADISENSNNNDEENAS